MKIIQLNTCDIDGGAARSAYRLHRGLVEIGQDSQLLTLSKQSCDETVILLRPQSLMVGHDDKGYLDLIQESYINANRTSLSNTLFSLSYPGVDLTQLSSVLMADIINLHWIAYFQSPVTLKKLLDLGKPIVWTLHDMWAFTGGCHYSSGCNQYQQDCSICPQLASDSFGLASALLKDKLELLNQKNLTIVTPSQWLAELARKSQLFRNNRIEVIPYSLETDTFFPWPKEQSKLSLGIPTDTFTVLIGAADGNEKRKGFKELLEALQFCAENIHFTKLLQAEQFKLLCFGVPNRQLESLDIPVISFGKITSDRDLSLIYAAADIFVLPSLEDNLPNTMLEAMSCGTPIIAFNTGGMPDIIQHDITGKLVSVIDPQKMAEAILECIHNRLLCKTMGEKCRQKMERDHSLAIQAQNYLNLYKDLLLISPASKGKVYPILNEPSQTLAVPIDGARGSNFENIFLRIVLSLTQAHLNSLRNQLHEMEAEIERSKDRIKAMETSKFWQLRHFWILFKQAVGLQNQE
ncbi:MAG: glycosyltransferase family 4 protein [Snowella sp.]|nr:glycosyltransferase family 4 protein [Snowella sp.]